VHACFEATCFLASYRSGLPTIRYAIKRKPCRVRDSSGLLRARYNRSTNNDLAKVCIHNQLRMPNQTNDPQVGLAREAERIHKLSPFSRLLLTSTSGDIATPRPLFAASIANENVSNTISRDPRKHIAVALAHSFHASNLGDSCSKGIDKMSSGLFIRGRAVGADWPNYLVGYVHLIEGIRLLQYTANKQYIHDTNSDRV